MDSIDVDAWPGSVGIYIHSAEGRLTALKGSWHFIDRLTLHVYINGHAGLSKHSNNHNRTSDGGWIWDLSTDKTVGEHLEEVAEDDRNE